MVEVSENVIWRFRFLICLLLLIYFCHFYLEKVFFTEGRWTGYFPHQRRQQPRLLCGGVHERSVWRAHFTRVCVACQHTAHPWGPSSKCGQPWGSLLIPVSTSVSLFVSIDTNWTSLWWLSQQCLPLPNGRPAALPTLHKLRCRRALLQPSNVI